MMLNPCFLYLLTFQYLQTLKRTQFLTCSYLELLIHPPIYFLTMSFCGSDFQLFFHFYCILFEIYF